MPRLFSEWRLQITSKPHAAAYYDVALSELTPTLLERCSEAVHPNGETIGLIRRLVRESHDAPPGFRAERLGSLLSSILLPPAVRRELLLGRDRTARNNSFLRLHLDIQVSELACWPWEYVYLHDRYVKDDPSRGAFLCTDPFISIVRQSGGPAPDPGLPGRGKIRVLIVWAGGYPGCSQAPPVGGLQEICAAYHGLSEALSHRVEIRFAGSQHGTEHCVQASQRETIGMLERDRWHMVIFMCHGDEGGLLIASDKNRGLELWRGQDLAETLAAAGVQVVLINACNSGDTAAAVSRRVPIVLGMQTPVALPTATTFWRAFFHALSQPAPIDLCVLHGRQWVQRIANLPDWGIPVLYRGSVQANRPLQPARPWRDPRPPIVRILRQFRRRLTGMWGGGGGLLEAAAGPAVSSTQPWVPPVVRTWAGADPWHLLLLGQEQQQVRWSQPIWWTALRQVPTFLIWPSYIGAFGYDIEIVDSCSGKTADLQSLTNALALDDWQRTAAGSSVFWAVTAKTEGDRPIRCVQGVFKILSQSACRQVRQLEQEASGCAEGLARDMLLVDIWLRHELYDEALWLLHALAEQRGNGPAGYVVRRLLGAVFLRIYEKLSQDLSWPGPEVNWAGAENEKQMMLAYCAALGRLHVYCRGECGSCRRCGLV